MKPFAIVAIFLVFVFSLFPQEKAGAENEAVAFEVTLADLYHAAENGDDRSIPSGKILVIDAGIGSVTVRADTNDQFIAEVELIGGAWHGEDSVELYRAYAVFEGTRYHPFFSRKSTTRFQTGDRILVLGQYLGIGVDYDETTPVAIIEGVDLRPLE